MASHEGIAITDEWYTPAWIFDAIDVKFDLDPCAAPTIYNAPASRWASRQVLGSGGLEAVWSGSVWLNPPYGGRNGIWPWLRKLAEHGDGIAIVPNRTGSDWWQDAANHAMAFLFIRGKVKFIRPDGSEGKSPGYGNVLMSFGDEMTKALEDAKICGLFVTNRKT